MNNDLDIVHQTPVEELTVLLPSLSAEQRSVAKLKLRQHKVALMEVEADKWREAQLPSNMQKPMVVRIKQYPGPSGRPTAAYGSWQYLSNRLPGFRVIRPGEILVVDVNDPNVRRAIAKGIIEIVMGEPPTRPIIYPDAFIAEALDPVKRSHRKLPQAHVDNAKEQANLLMAEIRRQYDATLLAKSAPAADDLPEQVQQQLAQQELEQEVRAETEPPFKTTVEHHEDGEPVKNADSVVVRKRSRG